MKIILLCLTFFAVGAVWDRLDTNKKLDAISSEVESIQSGVWIVQERVNGIDITVDNIAIQTCTTAPDPKNEYQMELAQERPCNRDYQFLDKGFTRYIRKHAAK